MNVSLDALAPDRFFQLTRRNSLQQVLDGLAAAEKHPELRPIKVNVVALKDFTEDEVVRFAEFARKHPYEVRFIEFMPLDADRTWSRDRVLPNAEVRRLIHAAYPLKDLGRERHGTSRRWEFADGQGSIGFISPVTRAVLRRLQPHPRDRRGQAAHLPVLDDRDRPARRRCAPARPTTSSRQIIRDAVWEKELKHHVNDAGFVPAAPARCRRSAG